jgi:8-oxo-dGTP diphosphatase
MRDNVMRLAEPNPRVCVALAFESDDRVLCVRRAKDPEAGSWSLPAGHVEFGESLEEALTREVAEEAGMKCVGVKFLGTYEYLDGDFHFIVLLFTSRTLSGVLEAGDDALEVAFLPWKSLAGQPHMQSMFQRARELLYGPVLLTSG